MLVVILAVSFLAFLHTWFFDRHLAFVTTVVRADHPVQTPLQRVRPGFTADVSMWIHHALSVLEGREGPRVRHTSVDNAPFGREVHWNSALTWWLAGLGWGWHQLSGTPIPAAVERAAVWANLPLVIAFIAGFGWWAGRRAGALAGALVAVAIFGHRSIYEGFLPAYPDHHGLIAGGVLGLMLGLLFMGGGWIKGPAAPPGLSLLPGDEAAAVRAARWGGFWGGFGLWISTASLAIPLFTVALAGVLATLACRRSLAESGARFHAGVWRAWGRAGAITSLAFYLFEYFPFHLAWRLEVNHPLYALSWWAGAELTASALEALTAPPGRRRAPSLALARRALWAVPAALAPALVILWRRSEVFLPLDPFLARLHGTIAEFLPFQVRLGMDNFRERLDYIITYPALFAFALVLLPIVSRAQRFGLILCLVPGLALQALGFWQGRWAMSAGSAQVPLLLVCLACACSLPLFGATSRRRWLLGVAAGLLFFTTAPGYYFKNLYHALRHNLVPLDETLEIVYREIAQAIRESQPAGPVVLYASPNASVGISYYGRFQTLGTLYWENRDGLRAAAQLTAAPGEDAAARIVRRLGVTHLAIVSRDNYVAEYSQFLHPGLTPAGLSRTFGYQLLGKGQIPVWLEPLLYRPPPNLPGDLASLRVLLFKVNFDQNETTLFYRLGLLLALQDRLDDALARFARAGELDPKAPAPWLRRGEILARQQKWPEAAADFLRGTELSDPADRYRLHTQSGIVFDHAGEVVLAMDFYRRAVALPMNNGIALNNLAWRLATANRAALRDPVLALRYADGACTIEPDAPGCHDTMAAALAANDRFPEALAAVARAIELASKADDVASLRAYRRHEESYRAALPWRE